MAASKKVQQATDKRSRTYKNSQSKAQMTKIAQSEGPKTTPSIVEDIPCNFTIYNMIENIRSAMIGIAYGNARLISCVNSIVFIERNKDNKEVPPLRSTSITDNLDDITWQLNALSDTYFSELNTLEKFIGSNNNKICNKG